MNASPADRSGMNASPDDRPEKTPPINSREPQPDGPPPKAKPASSSMAIRLPVPIVGRVETCRGIYSLMMEHKVVEIRGANLTGKTTLLWNYSDYLRIHHPELAVLKVIPKLMSERTFLEFIVAQVAPTIPCTAEELMARPDLVFLISGVERLQYDRSFWLDIIRARNGSEEPGPYFVLVSSYGRPEVRQPPRPHGGYHVPLCLSLAQRVSHHALGLEKPSLFFSRAEFNEAVDTISRTTPIQFTMAEDLRDYIWNLTLGHPGAVINLVEIFGCLPPYWFEEGFEIDTKKAKQLLDEDGQVVAALMRSSLYLCFPASTWYRACPHGASTLADVIAREQPRHPYFLDYFYQYGWIHAEMKTHVGALAFGRRKDESLGVTARVAYTVPSNVHRKCLEYLLLDRSRFPDYMFPTCFELLKSTLAKLSRSNLSLANRRNNKTDYTPGQAREVAYRREVFRAMYLAFGRKIRASSEWSDSGTDLRPDFYIPAKKWVIDVIAEGEGLSRRRRRFAGSYEPWMKRRNIRDGLLLDFRWKNKEMELFRPTETLPLYYIVIADSFRAGKVFMSDLTLIHEFQIKDH